MNNASELSVIKKCIEVTGKSAFGLSIIRNILIKHFGKSSLRYNHISKGYLKTFVSLAEQDNLGTFRENELLFRVNMTHPDIIDYIEELAEKKKKQDKVA